MGDNYFKPDTIPARIAAGFAPDYAYKVCFHSANGFPKESWFTDREAAVEFAQDKAEQVYATGAKRGKPRIRPIIFRCTIECY